MSAARRRSSCRRRVRLRAPLALKLESLQVSGSFKGRGAFHKLLASKVPAAGIVAASGGNHGVAAAYAAARSATRPRSSCRPSPRRPRWRG
jgi:threonine dehydratase